MKGFNDFGPRSLDLEVLGLRLCRGFLGHGQRQDSVFIVGLDALDVDLGHVETSGVRTVVTLAANVIALVVLFALAVLVLGMDGQNVIVDIDVDIFFLKARQFGLEEIALPGGAAVAQKSYERAKQRLMEGRAKRGDR